MRGFNRRFSARWCAWMMSAALLLLSGGAPLRADDEQRVDELLDRFSEQLEAAQLPAAEATAKELIQIGERRREDNPFWISLGWENLATVYLEYGRFQESAELYQRCADWLKDEYGAEDPDYADAIVSLGNVHANLGQFDLAASLIAEALPVLKQELGDGHQDVAFALNCLAFVKSQQDDFEEAESLYRQSLAVSRKADGPDSTQVAFVHDSLASLYLGRDRLDDAESEVNAALSIRRKLFSADHIELADSYLMLGEVCLARAKYVEAEREFAKAVDVNRRVYGEDSYHSAACLAREAYAMQCQGRLVEAEQKFRRAQDIAEKKLGPNHPDVALAVYATAAVNLMQGRFVEAEALYKRALAIQKQVFGGDNVTTATTQYELGQVYLLQGRYADAEIACRQALSVMQAALGPRSTSVADVLYVLGNIHWSQRRMDQAADYFARSLEIVRNVYGDDHPEVAWSASALGMAYTELGRYAEARELIQQAIDVASHATGAAGTGMASHRLELGRLYWRQGEYDLAAENLESSLSAFKRALGNRHPDVAGCLVLLAKVRAAQDRPRDAEDALNQAILILDQAGGLPDDRYSAYSLRAKLGWQGGRRSEALADLRAAMEIAEQQRANSTGSERERAKFFVNFANVYEQMVAWQTELGDVAEAVQAIERARSRSLLDELSISGASMRLGRTAAEREQIQKREDEIKSRLASWEQQRKNLLAAGAESPSAEAVAEVDDKLAAARQQLYEHYRDVRGTNPIYRTLLSTGAGPPRLSQIQRGLVRDKGLLLAYLIGEQGSYVAILTSDSARLTALTCNDEVAALLGVEAGPLTHEQLTRALVGEGGVMKDLARAKPTSALSDKLWALWELLVPPDERELITQGQTQRLIVMPDGPLALLPFEALVVRRGERPTYLLDAGPPIHYGPSATILMNLQNRDALTPDDRAPDDRGRDDRGPDVLSVGDPSYESAAAATGVDDDDALSAGARYAALGGDLPRLPYTGWESRWVHDVFGRQDVAVEQLTGAEATEANVRKLSPGRKFLHLACHGLVDQSHGNLFGSLALSPPSQLTDSTDDGFLTLAEIYEMDLHGCELAILSACNTNYGPQQRGEGVWALSRGFHVSGARRVVASNWVVDDRAAASLISYFCSGIARKAGADDAIDYARALQAAKKWVRDQESWAGPYYWATFVLVGPN